MTTNGVETRRDTLRALIISSISDENRNGNVDYYIALAFMIITLLASALAALGGLALGFTAKVTGFIALFPGIIAFAETQIKLQGKANWHYRKRNELETIRQRLDYQLPTNITADNIAAISRSLSEITLAMQKEWEDKFSLNWMSFHRRG